jgi:hypothetical protein
LVDDEDYERITQDKWHITGGSSGLCVVRTNKSYGPWLILMHHEVIGKPPSGMETDHINGNTLDNRKENLRHVTHRQNMQNRHQRKTSRFPGVSAFRDKWRSDIRIKGKSKYLGIFKDEMEAFCAYRRAVERLGESVV